MPSEAFEWPKKTHEIQNRISDSTRWNEFKFRADDIVVCTYAKTGTTWTQQIVAQLVFKGAADAVGPQLSPWLDFRVIPLADVFAQLEAQTHRRFIKTHLPLSALVFSPSARYIYVGRDVRDVVWSLYNHVANFTDQALDRFNAPPDLGPPVERPRGDERQFYHDFLEGPDAAQGSSGSFWEHVQGWWDIRGLPNVMLVHFANLKADLPGEISRIARFLDIPIDEAALPRIVEHCGFDYMQQAAASTQMLDIVFKDGAKTFFNKGTNGRWKDVLTAKEIARADEVAARNLTPDCAHWLKTGELPSA